MSDRLSPSGRANDRQLLRHAPDLSQGPAGLTALHTLRDFIRLAVSCFESAELTYGHGQAGSYDEAVALVFWAANLPAHTPDSMLDARLLPAEVACIVELISRRTKTRKPLAYLTGEAWLHGLRFLSDERALVPRSLLVESLQEDLSQWLTAEHDPDTDHWPAQVLDLCTGGGSIAIHAAFRYPDAQICAVDIDPDALDLCRANVALHRLEDRIALHQSDLLERVGEPARFDLILCNPPYVPITSMVRLPDEFRAEPAIALDGGNDGMDIIRRILIQARDRLTDEGLLLLEIGHEIEGFSSAFEQLSFAMIPVAAGDQMVILMTRQDLVHGIGAE